mgnify:CR=1 FL=1
MRRRPRRILSAGLLVVLTGLAVACSSPPLTCGEYPEGGGPARIRTRDQLACELVRQRVLQYMARATDLGFERAERIWEQSARWGSADDVAELVRVIRRDAGDAFADGVARAVEAARNDVSRELGVDCATQFESCLVAAAVKGAQLALAQRGYYVRGARPEGDGVPSSLGLRAIDVDDLVD